MKILFCILTTNKYRDTRQAALKKTWLQGVDYFFASDINDGDQICLSSKTDHASAEEKQLGSIIHAFDKMPEYDYYFFCDDDTFVNKQNLEFLRRLELDCVGSVLSEELDPMNPLWRDILYRGFRYFSGGAGFILNRATLAKCAVYLKNSEWPNTRYGDISVGIILEKVGVVPLHSPLFNKDAPEKMGGFNPSAITYHYIKEDKMYELQNLS